METEYTEKKFMEHESDWVSEWEWKNNNKKVLIFFRYFFTQKKLNFFNLRWDFLCNIQRLTLISFICEACIGATVDCDEDDDGGVDDVE